MNKNGKNVNWVSIRAKWEAGTPVRKLADAHRISVSRIHQVKRKQAWTPKSRADKGEIVAASTHNVDAKQNDGVKAIGKGRSIGQPLGDEGRDQELLSDLGALLTGRPPEEGKAILDQAATEIELMRQHRGTISRASLVAENILNRLYALVIDGQAADVITFETKRGEAYHRVPFLGDRESVSDALLKCVNAISKLVPLERQAHGLTDEQTDKLPTINFNMPGLQVINVDGKGQIIKKVAIPAPIDGKAEHVATQ